jgi:hypothetical protein
MSALMENASPALTLMVLVPVPVIPPTLQLFVMLACLSRFEGKIRCTGDRWMLDL